MGVAVVLVTPTLIESFLRPSDQMTALRVVEGLPDGSRLVDVSMVAPNGHLVVRLQFEGPGLPERVPGQPLAIITPKIARAPAVMGRPPKR